MEFSLRPLGFMEFLQNNHQAVNKKRWGIVNFYFEVAFGWVVSGHRQHYDTILWGGIVNDFFQRIFLIIKNQERVFV